MPVKSALALVTTSLVPDFNRVVNLGVFEPATAAQIDEILELYARAHVPFTVQLSPIARPDLSGVIIHGAKSVADDVVKMPDRRFSQTIEMKRWRTSTEATAHGHSVSGADMIVARRAEDVVALAAALQDVGGDLKWKCRRELAIHAAREEMLVFIQEPASHHARGQRPGRPMVCKKSTLGERLVSRLIRHLLPAAGKH